ncbi:metallophosphoesterase family protein [Paenibacillus wenxiniae]|uniref:Metallophosphoesterase n=1 Tax=Paenibacillus wenxiniae TaxID=1636843 RepID=A0ABW4RR72_9BACL
MIYVTGDTHGMPWLSRRLNTRSFPQQKQLTKQDTVIIVGDFGLIWDWQKEDQFWLKWLDEVKPFTTVFIDGNHENFDLLEQFPIEQWNGGHVHRINDSVLHLMRGQVYTIEGKRLFTFGGAASHDREYRKEGKSWWARELPSAEEYEYGLQQLEKYNWDVDVVITHTCSRESLAWITQHYNTNVEPDVMHDYFQTIQDQLNYRQWWFGHFHQDVELPNRQRLIYYDLVQI